MTGVLRRYVLHNIGLKLLALVAAVLLWVAVARAPMVEIALSVPIEFHHVPEDLEISSENIPQAQVRVRGPEREVRAINASEVHAIIDLAGTRPGERTYELAPSKIQAPGDVEVEQVVPAQLRLSFDTRGSRSLPVRPRVTGSFVSGYRLASVVAEPAVVLVVGPEKRVNALDAAVTDPVDASGLMGTSTFTTHAHVADPMVRLANPGPIRVTVVTEKAGDRPAPR